jgi:hypothetical protein
MNTMRNLFLLLACLLVPGTALAQTVEQKQATIRYLTSLQNADGGFRATAAAKQSSLRATSSALRALRYFGGSVPNTARCKDFVERCHDRSGGFADTPGGKADVVLTAVGLMAMIELQLPTDRIKAPAIAYLTDHAKEFEQVRMAAAGLEALGERSSRNETWLKELAARQNPDGTFGKGPSLVRDTGSAVACMLRLGGKCSPQQTRAILAALDAGQNKDGGFGKATASDLETSYRVVRTYVMLGAKPARADDLRAFIARCRNADGGYGLTPGSPSAVTSTYFAAILLHWLNRP